MVENGTHNLKSGVLYLIAYPYDLAASLVSLDMGDAVSVWK